MNIITGDIPRQFSSRVSSSRKDNKFGLPACTTSFMKCSSLHTSCRPLKIGRGGALSSLGRPNCIVCPNLCVKRLLLAWGERGEGGGRRERQGEERYLGRERGWRKEGREKGEERRPKSGREGSEDGKGRVEGMGKRGEGERWERKPKRGREGREDGKGRVEGRDLGDRE